MILPWSQLLLRFVIGGLVVVSTTLLAQYRTPLVAGIVNNFPSMSLTSLVILLLAAPTSQLASGFAKSTLMTLPLYIIFLLAFVIFSRLIDSKVILVIASLGVWLIGTCLFLFFFHRGEIS